MRINGQDYSLEEIDSWNDARQAEDEKRPSNLGKKPVDFIIDLGIKIGNVLSVARMIFPNGK